MSRAFAWVVVAHLCALTAVGAQAPSTPDPLVRIADIRALSLEEGSRGHAVLIRGIVTHFDLRHGAGLVVHDGDVGQYVQRAHRDVEGWSDLQLGDLVEIAGRTKRGGYAPNVSAERVRRLGRKGWPVAQQVSYSDLLTGRHDCDFVQITGTVQRAWDHGPGRTLFTEVAVEGGTVRATFWDYTPADIDRLVGAQIRVAGNAGTLQDEAGHLRGLSLLVNRARDVEVLTPAEPPFSLPLRSLDSLYRHTPTGELFRRIRVTGIVTAYVPGRSVRVPDNATGHAFPVTGHVLYIQEATGAARVETDQPTPVTPGDRVEVAGFPFVTPGKPVLRHAVVRVVGAGVPPAPLQVPAPFVLTPERDSMLVSLQARLLAVAPADDGRALVFEAGSAIVHGAIPGGRDAAAVDAMPPGSVVNVTGVYAYQAGSPPSFRLYLRSPADMVLLESGPWWTLRHTAVTATLIVSVLGLAGFGAWTNARRRRQHYQAILGERTRVARELHDTLEQGLAGIALQLEAVAGTLGPATERARRPLDLARQMLRYSLEEARRSVLDLRSQALETTDLPGALLEMARGMTQGTDVTADVQVEGPRRRLDAAQEHHLLRIGLEAVTNAIKHARPGRIEIALRFAPTEVELVVRDDGAGFAADAPPSSLAHFGLRGLRERADKLGGAVRIESAPGAGTTVAVAVPCAPGRRRIA